MLPGVGLVGTRLGAAASERTEGATTCGGPCTTTVEAVRFLPTVRFAGSACDGGRAGVGVAARLVEASVLITGPFSFRAAAAAAALLALRSITSSANRFRTAALSAKQSILRCGLLMAKTSAATRVSASRSGERR